MAQAAAVRRVNENRVRARMNAGYEDGNAVRVLDGIPVEQPRESAKERSIRRAREKAQATGRSFVIFLSVICCITMFLCVNYLQQKARITAQYEEIALLESRYDQMKRDNDARYNQVVNSVTMEDVKEAAIKRLGMHYAGADQIQYYSLTEDSYVRQYKEVSAGR